MTFSLPYFRGRRYLTGIDWIIGALARSGGPSAAAGGFSQAVLEVQGHLPEQPLAAALEKISSRFPLIHGRVARDAMNLAPFWKVGRAARRGAIPLRVVDLDADAQRAADCLLDEHVNAPALSERHHLSFLLLRLGSERSRLGMVFDHRLLDAFGAEALLRLIDQTWQGRLDEIAPLVRQAEPAHLDHWWRRFFNGGKLQAMLQRVGQQDVCALAMPGPDRPPRVRYLFDSMSVQETALFNERAADEISVPVSLPSAVARGVLALRRGAGPLPLAGTQYTVFTTVSMRSPAQEWESLFFNQFSLLLFTAAADAPDSPPQLAMTLRDQFFEQMKLNIPVALQDAAILGRIVPRWLAAKWLRWPFKGRLCSLYFACLKESGYPGDTFFGLPALNLFHMPPAFAPPGLNICMTYFAGRFNIVLSYIDGALDDTAAARILDQFKATLIQ